MGEKREDIKRPGSTLQFAILAPAQKEAAFVYPMATSKAEQLAQLKVRLIHLKHASSELTENNRLSDSYKYRRVFQHIL